MDNDSFSQVKVQTETEVKTIQISQGVNEEEEEKFFSEKAIRRIVTVKDEGCISDKNYHELKMVNGVHLPPLSQIKTHQKEMEGVIPIHPINTV